MCNKTKKISTNPAQDLETPKLGKRLPKYLTLDQSKELLQEAAFRHCSPLQKHVARTAQSDVAEPPGRYQVLSHRAGFPGIHGRCDCSAGCWFYRSGQGNYSSA